MLRKLEWKSAEMAAEGLFCLRIPQQNLRLRKEAFAEGHMNTHEVAEVFAEVWSVIVRIFDR